MKTYSYKFRILTAVILSFTVGTLFTSCEKDVPDKYLPTVSPQLVLNSFIAPNNDISVRVTQTIPIYTSNVVYNPNNVPDERTVIANAEVSIKSTSSNESVEIPFDENRNVYFLPKEDFNIELGEEYELLVKHRTLGQASAKAVVPDKLVQLQNFNIDTLEAECFLVDYDEYYCYYNLRVSGQIVDHQDEKNYYRVLLLEGDNYEGETNWEYVSYEILLTDADAIDGKLGFKVDVFTSQFYRTLLKVFSLDYGYYQFHRTLFNTMESNPFIEPTPVYSNVKGGKGIFSAYNELVIQL